MNINCLSEVQNLLQNKLIVVPQVSAHNQVSRLSSWCDALRSQQCDDLVQLSFDTPSPSRRDYFPALPTAAFTQANHLQSPQQPVLFVGKIKLGQQVVATASAKTELPDNNRPGDSEASAAAIMIPSHDKTYYLAGHIEVATGDLVFTNPGFNLTGPINFAWFNRYRSSIKQDFGLGPGWLHPLCERLWLRPPSEEGSPTMIDYLRSDGRSIQFAQPRVGEACVNRNEGMVLERLGSMNYRLICPDEADRVFRTDGTNPWLPLVEIRDAADNVLSIDYQNGQAQKIVSSWGRVIDIHYRDNRISELKSSAADADKPPLAAYEYSAEGLLVVARDSWSRSEQYRYEESYLKQRQQADGRQLSFEWNREQQRYCSLRQAELLQHIKWQARLRRADISNNLGHRSSAQFDTANRLIQWTDAEGHSSKWFYDAYGNLCSHTNPLGRTEYYRWDKCGRCVRRTQGLGVSTHYRYDEQGNLLQVDNSAGQIWRREYNACGQVVAEQDPLGNVWRYSYNDKFLLQELQDPEGGKTRLQWNSLAELAQVTSQEGKVTGLHYNTAGQLVSVQRADQTLIEYTYDERNRLQSLNPLGAELWQIHYDDYGRIIRIVLPGDRGISYEYDDQGRRTSEKSHRGKKSEYRFDTAGNCVEVLSSSGSQHREYNRVGWLLATQNSAGHRQSFQYDAAGQLIQHRDMSVIVNIERNTEGRATKITNNSGESCRFDYDELSRLVFAENRWGSLRFQYNLCNKLIAEHQELEHSGSHSILHSYDRRGWQLTTNTDRHLLRYLTSPDGLLRGVDIGPDALFRCDYDALDRETEWVYGELKTSIIRQNHAVQAIQTRNQEAAVVFEQRFTNTKEWQSGLYRSVNEEKFAQHNDSDERGNLTKEESYLYNYDGWNNLITAESGDFKTYYSYDAFGRRIAKTTTHRKSKNVRQSVFCWLGNHLWNETHKSPKGEDYFCYLRHPIHGGLLAFLANDKTYYYLNSPSLQPLALLSRRGENLWHARYGEAGEYRCLEKKPKINSPWRALKAYYDIETKLHYLGNRYYSPKLGVFLQRDASER